MCFRAFGVLILAGLPLIGQATHGLEKEAALGKQLAAEFRQRTTEIDSAIVQEYVERVQVRTADRDQRLAAILSAIGKLPPAEYAAAPSDEFPVVQQEVRHLSEPVRARAPPSLVRKRPE